MPMFSLRRFAPCLPALMLLAALAIAPAGARADRITYVTEEGESKTVEARIHGSDRGALALEMDDGSLVVIAEGQITKREPTDGPEPLDADGMIERLSGKFGRETFRAEARRPFVVGLVLAAPLSGRIEETRTEKFLESAVDFMKQVETQFKEYAGQARIPNENPRHTLVALIFESDEDFEEYVVETTGGTGLSAGRVAGFYSGMSNFLVLRLSECYNFQTPLHEGMHQQVYNRGVFQRLAPLPTWFNEGIATSFEGDGDRIRNGPYRINTHFARRIIGGDTDGVQLGWGDTVQHNRAFRGDIFAGDAYTNAWALHWHTLNFHPDEYREYVARLGEKEPLTELSPEQQLAEFEEVFGAEPEELHKEFLEKLPVAMRRQRVSPTERETVGFSETQSNLGEVQLTAVRQAGGPLQVEGKLTNISPLRDMSYYVAVVTGTGEYADWHLPNLSIRKSVPLQRQFAAKRLAGGGLGTPGTFRVLIQSTPAGSDEAAAWKRGQLPTLRVSR
jgi:hypothetical protein